MHKGREAAAILKEDDLLLSFQTVDDGFHQFIGQELLSLLIAEIDDFYDRQSVVQRSLRQGMQRVFPGLSIVPAFQRGSGGTQNDLGIIHLRAHHCQVSALVTWSIILFVGLLVLLIHDNEPQSGHRGEDGAAGTDDDPAFAASDLLPLRETLCAAKLRMLDRQFIAETAVETIHHLGCERDLRDQEDHPLILSQIFADQFDIHFGFAASGDPIEQMYAKLALLGQDIPHYLLLSGIEHYPAHRSGRFPE